jgi:hypothetical protein
MQQWTLLRESGQKTPDPIKNFYEDLEKILQSWNKLEYEIILLINANETIGDKPGGLTPILSQIGLIDLIQNQHQIDESSNTYARGTKRIDYIFGSQKIHDHCLRSGMLPFGVGYQSDHRALFIKVDIGKILQTSVTQIDTIMARKLTQATPKERHIFLENLDNHYRSQNLYQRLRKLTEVTESEWDDKHKETYEKCDQEMVAGMLTAESCTKKTKTTSWSPTFAQAINDKTFWKIALSLKINHRRASPEFQTWANKMGIHDIHATDISTIKQYFRAAQKHLKEIEKQADKLREDHLRSMLTTAELNRDEKKVEKRLQILI